MTRNAYPGIISCSVQLTPHYGEESPLKADYGIEMERKENYWHGIWWVRFPFVAGVCMLMSLAFRVAQCFLVRIHPMEMGQSKEYSFRYVHGRLICY